MIKCPQDAGGSLGEEKIMRLLRSKKKWTAATIGVAMIGMLATVALGSPGSGITTTNFVTANFDHTVHLNSDQVKFQTKDFTDVRIQRLVFAPGSYSGWHHHPGMVLVTVESGAVTLWKSDCSSTTYGPTRPSSGSRTTRRLARSRRGRFQGLPRCPARSRAPGDA